MIESYMRELKETTVTNQWTKYKNNYKINLKNEMKINDNYNIISNENIIVLAHLSENVMFLFYFFLKVLRERLLEYYR